MKSPTMRDVAQVAGVHQSTVSLALRHHPSIPAATREAIERVARELGYRPHPWVSALMADRRKRRPIPSGAVLAFLPLMKQPENWRRHRNQLTLYETLEAHAFQRGYRLEEANLGEPGMTPQRMKSILLHRGIRGLLIYPTAGCQQTFEFDFTPFAAVVLGLTLQQPALDHVSIDYNKVLRLAVDELRARGRQRIGFVTLATVDQRVQHLLLGTFLAIRHHDPAHFVQPLVYHQAPPCRQEILAWLETERPDVIITATLSCYKSLKITLEREGLTSPPLVSLNCTNGSSQTGVVQDLKEQARAAIDLLVSRLELARFGVPAQPRALLIGGTWQDGKAQAATARPGNEVALPRRTSGKA